MTHPDVSRLRRSLNGEKLAIGITVTPNLWVARPQRCTDVDGSCHDAASDHRWGTSEVTADSIRCVSVVV
jgi:hypothetical protein